MEKLARWNAPSPVAEKLVSSLVQVVLAFQASV
jgi:hypothetical protein